MKKAIGSAIFLTALYGCASTNEKEEVNTTVSDMDISYEYFDSFNLPQNNTIRPQIDQIATANTGDTILYQQTYDDWLSQDIKIAESIELNNLTLKPYGTKFKKVKDVGLIACMRAIPHRFCFIDKDFTGVIDKDFDGEIDTTYRDKYKSNDFKNAPTFKGEFDSFYQPKNETVANKVFKPVPYKLTTRMSKPKGILKTLIFQGLKAGEIQISYREFTKDGLARPSFNQDIMFEASKRSPTIIGFKGAKIEVLSVNSLEIKYKLIKSFDYN